jgi:hypothetical protein
MRAILKSRATKPMTITGPEGPAASAQRRQPRRFRSQWDSRRRCHHDRPARLAFRRGRRRKARSRRIECAWSRVTRLLRCWLRQRAHSARRARSRAKPTLRLGAPMGTFDEHATHRGGGQHRWIAAVVLCAIVEHDAVAKLDFPRSFGHLAGLAGRPRASSAAMRIWVAPRLNTGLTLSIRAAR